MSLYQQGLTLKALLENPDLVNPPKKLDDLKADKLGGGSENQYAGQSAFLGPQLWDRTLPYTEDDNEFNLEYMDLDEFLQENGIMSAQDAEKLANAAQGIAHQRAQQQQQQLTNPQAFLPQPLNQSPRSGQGFTPPHIHTPQSPQHLQQHPQAGGSPSPHGPMGSPSRGSPHGPMGSPLVVPLSPHCLSPQSLSPQSFSPQRPTFEPKPEFVPSPPACSVKSKLMQLQHTLQLPQQQQQQQQHQQQQQQQPLSPSCPKDSRDKSKSERSSSLEEQLSKSPGPGTPPKEEPDTTDDDDDDDDDGEDSCSELGGENFDPRKRSFTEDELRPQPMIKKSKKVFVPDERKDDKYWSRRHKNNVAAKRSRDARRIKENQIAMRASFLERQSNNLEEEVERLMKENQDLKKRLAKYEKSNA